MCNRRGQSATKRGAHGESVGKDVLIRTGMHARMGGGVELKTPFGVQKPGFHRAWKLSPGASADAKKSPNHPTPGTGSPALPAAGRRVHRQMRSGQAD